MKPDLTISCETAVFFSFDDQSYEEKIATFHLDGMPLKSLLLKQTGDPSTRASLPLFQGPMVATVRRYADGFLKGYENRGPLLFRNLVPILACECGCPNCGGIWTRVFTGRASIFWSGFWYLNSDGTGRQLSPIRTFSDGRICCEQLVAFDRPSYVEAFEGLLMQPS